MITALNKDIWEKHYAREKSKLQFPDENVVRYLAKNFSAENSERVTLDLGCGSGRHLSLLRSFPGRHYGQDYTLGASAMSGNTVCALGQSLPYADNTFDFILCWGVLHYLNESEMRLAIAEILRVLKKNFAVFLTLRADDDTHLAQVTAQNGDLSGGKVRLFSVSEIHDLFNQFSKIQTGHISRIPLGEKYRVSHHMVEAVK